MRIIKKNIAIVTCCTNDWGGSEELWAKSISYIHNYGHQVTAYKTNFNQQHPEVKHLINQGVKLKELQPSYLFHKRIGRRLNYIFNRVLDRNYYTNSEFYETQNFRNEITKNRPDFVIISQGINFDGLHYAFECLKLNIPYLIVSHKAVEFYWPPVQDKKYMKEVFMKAKLCCFVSFHNLRLTEEQFGIRLSNSKVIFNPIKIKRQALRYPPTNQGFRLACIGRFFLIDKGQDILIRVLAQKKWRNRPITISFIGNGIDLINIKEMIDLYKLDNIQIENYQNDMESVWLNFHALILPSRSEGLPLTIIEAMAAGRPVIITNAGGNSEMVEQGVTGFIGEANKHSFDEAMELAWENRSQWESMGIKASDFIRKNIPESPEKNFANLLNKHL